MPLSQETWCLVFERTLQQVIDSSHIKNDPAWHDKPTGLSNQLCPQTWFCSTGPQRHLDAETFETNCCCKNSAAARSKVQMHTMFPPWLSEANSALKLWACSCFSALDHALVYSLLQEGFDSSHTFNGLLSEEGYTSGQGWPAQVVFLSPLRKSTKHWTFHPDHLQSWKRW